jgi:hypothetical protein
LDSFWVSRVAAPANWIDTEVMAVTEAYCPATGLAELDRHRR